MQTGNRWLPILAVALGSIAVALGATPVPAPANAAPAPTPLEAELAAVAAHIPGAKASELRTTPVAGIYEYSHGAELVYVTCPSMSSPTSWTSAD